MLRVEYQLLCFKRVYLIFLKLNVNFVSKIYINGSFITMEVRNVKFNDLSFSFYGSNLCMDLTPFIGIYHHTRAHIKL